MTKKIENKSYKFITLDGTGKDRAEVLIQRGKATVNSITKHEDKNTAQVEFNIVPVGDKVQTLKPIPAWVSLDDQELVNYLEHVQSSNNVVEYRIEVQRRGHVDRSIPFEQLYQSMDDALKNTIRIVAIVDGIVSSEAVTNPAEDPAFGNGTRHKADMSEHPVQQAGNQSNHNVNFESFGFDKTSSLNALRGMKKTPGTDPAMLQMAAAFAVILGADTNEVNQILWADKGTQMFSPATNASPRNFAIEAPRYQDFNSDGRVNLGSAYVASAVSMESAVSRNILNRYHDEVEGKPLRPSQIKGFSEFVLYFTDLSFSMCDYAQATMYGAGAFPSRKADSHTRVRGIFIDLIERFFFLPVVVDGDTLVLSSNAEVDEWIKNVGSTILHRFQSSLNILPNRTSFKELREQRNALPVLGGVYEDTAVTVQEQPEPVTVSIPDVADHDVSQVSNDVDDSAEYDQQEPFQETQVEVPEEEDYDTPLALDNSIPSTHVTETVAPEPAVEKTVETPVATNVDPERMKKAADLLKNFTPSKDYIQDIKNENEGQFPAEEEEEDVNIVEVAPGVIKIPAEGVEGPFSGDEEVSNFKALLDSSGFNLQDTQHVKTAGKILRFVFGPDFTMAQKVPVSLMNEFIDWYASAGPEAFTLLQEMAHQEFPG